jgi:hypothetical protein
MSLASVSATDKTQPLNVKVGLWQMTYTTEGSGPLSTQTIPPELLAKMTPEQRIRTEARLRARAAQGPHTENKQYCLTEERLKKSIFESAESPTCQRTMTASTAKLQQFHEECTDSGIKRIEDGRFEALDADTMKGSIKVKSEGSNPSTMSAEIIGKWMANDCGGTAQ